MFYHVPTIPTPQTHALFHKHDLGVLHSSFLFEIMDIIDIITWSLYILPLYIYIPTA